MKEKMVIGEKAGQDFCSLRGTVIVNELLSATETTHISKFVPEEYWTDREMGLLRFFLQ